MIESLDLTQYVVGGKDQDWNAALASKKRRAEVPSAVSIPNEASEREKKRVKQAQHAMGAALKQAEKAKEVVGKAKGPRKPFRR